MQHSITSCHMGRKERPTRMLTQPDGLLHEQEQECYCDPVTSAEVQAMKACNDLWLSAGSKFEGSADAKSYKADCPFVSGLLWGVHGIWSLADDAHRLLRMRSCMLVAYFACRGAAAQFIVPQTMRTSLPSQNPSLSQDPDRRPCTGSHPSLKPLISQACTLYLHHVLGIMKPSCILLQERKGLPNHSTDVDHKISAGHQPVASHALHRQYFHGCHGHILQPTDQPVA